MIRRLAALFGIVLLVTILVLLVWTVRHHRLLHTAEDHLQRTIAAAES